MIDRDELARICDARDVLCKFCECDECEKCRVQVLEMMLLQNARIAKTNDVYANQENMRTEIIPCAHYLSQEEK